jgi:parallel beta-helix repeat protein
MSMPWLCRPRWFPQARSLPWTGSRWFRPGVEELEARRVPAALLVTTAVDDTSVDGFVSLREAIQSINQGSSVNADVNAVGAYGSNDTIQFAIAGQGLQTINVGSTGLGALPTITRSVVIDGYTQAGASANTLTVGDNAVLTVELNGTAAGANANGLTIAASNSTIRGLIINRFAATGVSINSGTGNLIEGDFLGTDASGTGALGNGQYGVLIRNGATGNTIGGTGAGARNVISGNLSSGIRILGTGNTVAGNYVGTDITGLQALGNQGGVNDGAITIQNGGNTVGGTASGAGNVIAGNTGVGILVYNTGSAGNTIQGNLIGLGADGTTAVNNSLYGIYLALASVNTLIGGPTAAARNVIGANGFFGIFLDAGAVNTTIQGNYIGTDSSGTLARSNRFGIYTLAPNTLILDNLVSGNAEGIAVVFSSATGDVIQGNIVGLNAAGTAVLSNNDGILVQGASGTLIGGTTASARNVISGNARYGVLINQGSSDVVVEGNTIGTDPTGTAALGNGQAGPGNGAAGVFVIDSSNNTIGGLTSAPGTGAGNLISGNRGNGVDIEGSSSGNVVEGNLIGTNASGTGALGNGLDGVLIRNGATGNTIGGTSPGARNVISGNQHGEGVDIASASDNVIAGNFIGTDVSGTVALGNTGGVFIEGGASRNTIGGFTETARNVISGNQQGDGVDIASASDNVIAGNYIGTDVSGTVALGNQGGGAASGGNGILFEAASDNLISGNLISGNAGWGIFFFVSPTNGNVIRGNKIGTDASGTHALGNAQDGILFYDPGVTNNIIGGTTPGDGNLISGNKHSGIVIVGSGNVIQGNEIGTDISGTVALGNQADGIVLAGPTATNNTIGGSTAGAGNLVSGNGLDGIDIAGASGNRVQGNRIGTDINGMQSLSNQFLGGILLSAGATDNLIGGLASTPGTGAGNVISGNAGSGVDIQGNETSGNLVEGNLIGTDASGTAVLNNKGTGIFLRNGATSNTIGGTSPGSGNVISGNDTFGIDIDGSSTSDNLVEGNLIGTDLSGLHALGNSSTALGNGATAVLLNNATSNTIGGTTAAARNVISGNSNSYGITVSGTGNLIEGNYVGVDITGDTSLANSAGIVVSGTGNTIGGLTTTPGCGPGNVISGNTGIGVYLSFGDSNLVEGNLIGPGEDGETAVGNGSYGIYVVGTVNDTIGGTTAGAGNVVSSNASVGIVETGSGTTIAGNRIGTDASGTLARGNGFTGAGQSGIYGAGSNEVITNNLISGNTGIGLTLGADGAVVQGNLIGTRADGQGPLPNQAGGVYVLSASNTIGGTTPAARNIISGNAEDGIAFNTTSAHDNVLEDNYIGVASDGTTAVPNTALGGLFGYGVWLFGGAANNTIGGTESGAGNVISANATDGILISDQGTSGNVVEGNRIGTDATGTAALGNGVDGVLIQNGATDNTIGGVSPDARNIISANGSYGVLINLTGTQGNVVEGNFIGTDVTGTVALGNGASGVVIANGATSNTIGGTTEVPGTGAGNLISGNGVAQPIFAQVGLGRSADFNVIAGNLIGTDVTGTVSLGGPADGVQIDTGSSNNTIGGSSPGMRNIISGNQGYGVSIQGFSTGPNTSGNVVAGNFIGTDITGTRSLANTLDGVRIFQGATNNRIGTDINGVGLGNVIANNGGAGVDLTDSGTRDNSILGNSIHDNAGLGINLGKGEPIGHGIGLGQDGLAGNGNDLGKGGPNGNGINLLSLPNDGQNSPVLGLVGDGIISGTLSSTPGASFRLEFFASRSPDSNGSAQGETYLGSLVVMTDDSGQVSFNFAYTPVTGDPILTATATNILTLDTSEFSAFRMQDRMPPQPPPPQPPPPSPEPPPRQSPPGAAPDTPPTQSPSDPGPFLLPRGPGQPTPVVPLPAPLLDTGEGDAAPSSPSPGTESTSPSPERIATERTEGDTGEPDDRAAIDPAGNSSAFGSPLAASTRDAALNPVNSGLPANVSLVDAVQRRLINGSRPPGSVETEKEESSVSKAREIYSSTLDGDDSIRLVEALLHPGPEAPPAEPAAPSKNDPGTGPQPLIVKGVPLPEQAEVAAAPAFSAKRLLLTGLLVPAGVVVLAVGLWRRARARQRTRVDATLSGEGAGRSPGNKNVDDGIRPS